jgi:hypothetical protein
MLINNKVAFDEKSAKLILEHYKYELKDVPCSEKHHLNIKGGLILHLYNVLTYAKKYFPDDNELHFMALVHDIGKARVYHINDDNIIRRSEPEVDHILHTISMLARVDIHLTDTQLNALQFHHGGWSGFKGNLTEMAVKLHFCDMMATIHEK